MIYTKVRQRMVINQIHTSEPLKRRIDFTQAGNLPRRSNPTAVQAAEKLVAFCPGVPPGRFFAPQAFYAPGFLFWFRLWKLFYRLPETLLPYAAGV